MSFSHKVANLIVLFLIAIHSFGFAQASVLDQRFVSEPSHQCAVRFTADRDLHQALEVDIVSRCEGLNVSHWNCRICIDEIHSLRSRELRSRTALNASYSFEKKHIVPNSHLTRSSTAIDAELENMNGQISFRRLEDIYFRERIATRLIFARIDESLSIRRGIIEWNKTDKQHLIANDTRKSFRQSLSSRRLSMNTAVIHSCLLPNTTSTRILGKILDDIFSPEMEMDLLLVVVVHFGSPLPEDFIQQYSSVLFVHMSEDISFFEVPTIRIVRSISAYLDNQWSKQQNVTSFFRPLLLYLHTKGISYTSMHPQIEEWRDYMTYFVIEKHTTAVQLLLSGQYDVYGTNYGAKPRTISGNFWWATCAYLRSLPNLEFEHADKYSAELWLLNSSHVKVYFPFVTSRDHAFERYPRYCYAEIGSFYSWNRETFLNDVGQYQYMLDVQDLPTFDTWQKHCPMLSYVHYQSVHEPVSGPADFDIQSFTMQCNGKILT